MGSEYLLSPKIVKEVFGLNSLKNNAEEYIDKEDCFDYFNLVAVLFYIKNHEEYNQIKADVVKEINKRLKRIDRVSFDARICYLLLDSMSCPYIDQKVKKQWGLKLEKVLYGKALLDAESNEFLQQLVTNHWFVCWNDEQVLNNLIVKNNLLFGY